MARIAVIGPGAIGGTVAAWLAQDPAHDVTLCARTRLAALEIETPGGAIRATPRVVTDPAAAEPVDWVIAAVKTYDCAAAAAWLPGLMGPETRLAVFQNGVEHRERFRGLVPDEAVIPAIVDIPAERSAPGRILQRRYGTVVVPAGEDAFVALFANTPIEASTTTDFVTAAWRKLAINCAGIVNGIALQPNGLAHDEGVAEVIRAVVRECVAVGRAEGAAMPDSIPDEIVANYRAGPRDGVHSLLADRLAGRRTEVDARNVVIDRIGRRHGIDAPMNRALAALLIASGG
ncbi:2-dehydropantoate 2-reductase [Sphingomonas sp.]|uniref:2-dehydropantoate 2-reductase n=1 Tax=Sphingomonas sp. TaxID=28214 RepID=UPI001B08207A|nr:2-dehydropantoate 2-reductase [Sphingomonas sp.]MBO9713851.1 2-dehydropantoate 2-reductase [Sphingomonas sp.]